MSHTQIECQEGIDSRLLVVGSQTANLTPGPCFAHNLGYKCLNCQCEGIFDIYVSRPFQRHQEHLNARCFAPCCRALNIRESRRTPNPNFFQVLGFTPHLAKVGLRQIFLAPLHSPKISSFSSVDLCSSKLSPSLFLLWFLSNADLHISHKNQPHSPLDLQLLSSRPKALIL